MKNYYIVPITAIFIVAMSVGDKFGSLPYIIKSSIALLLIAITVFLVKKDIRNKRNETNNKQKQT